ncbi:MAG TPA: TspO/MBR family protein [Candidatus Limnocylindrales bacterium]|nr:TspO/MBR family protein [Candidatus Limnocylindrales bacterium]
MRHRAADVALAAVPLVGGSVTGALTAGSIRTWYRGLTKPPWNPPDRVFAPVWTTLYLAMGVSLLRVSRLDRGRDDVRIGLALFTLQLGLNFGWSFVFFGARRPGLALAEIAALDAAVVATIVSFRRLDGAAAGLLLPYLAWISFATALTGSVWRLNR